MKTIIGWIVAIVVICFVFGSIGGIGKYEGQSAEYWFNADDEAEAQVEELQNKVNEYQTALQEANDNIEEANSNIDSAKSYEGASYDDMVDALNSLNTIETVSEP